MSLGITYQCTQVILSSNSTMWKSLDHWLSKNSFYTANMGSARADSANPKRSLGNYEALYLWSIFLNTLSHYLAGGEMAQESLILTFQLMQNVTDSLPREVSAQVPQEDKVSTVWGNGCSPVCLCLWRDEGYETWLKYLLQSIKEYIQKSNIKFHKSRPDALEMLTKKTKNERQKVLLSWRKDISPTSPAMD